MPDAPRFRLHLDNVSSKHPVFHMTTAADDADRYIVDALGIAIRNALALLDGLPLTNVVDAGRGY